MDSDDFKNDDFVSQFTVPAQMQAQRPQQQPQPFLAPSGNWPQFGNGNTGVVPNQAVPMDYSNAGTDQAAGLYGNGISSVPSQFPMNSPQFGPRPPFYPKPGAYGNYVRPNTFQVPRFRGGPIRPGMNFPQGGNPKAGRRKKKIPRPEQQQQNPGSD